MGKLLDDLPWWADVLLLALLVGGLWAAKTGYDRHEQGIGAERVQARWNDEKVAQQRQAIEDQAANAQKTQRRLDDMQRNIDEARKQTATAQADAADARSERDRLRKQQSTFLAAARARDAASNPATAGKCEATGAAADLFADMFSEADEATGILAAALDSARTAGLTCERAYDALTQH